MKVKIGKDVYVDAIYISGQFAAVPGGLGKVIDIEDKKSFSRKLTQLISIEEIPGAKYTWTNHLEKYQATLKKMYGKQRAGIKKDEPAE